MNAGQCIAMRPIAAQVQAPCLRCAMHTTQFLERQQLRSHVCIWSVKSASSAYCNTDSSTTPAEVSLHSSHEHTSRSGSKLQRAPPSVPRQRASSKPQRHAQHQSQQQQHQQQQQQQTEPCDGTHKPSRQSEHRAHKQGSSSATSGGRTQVSGLKKRKGPCAEGPSTGGRPGSSNSGRGNNSSSSSSSSSGSKKQLSGPKQTKKGAHTDGASTSDSPGSSSSGSTMVSSSSNNNSSSSSGSGAQLSGLTRTKQARADGPSTSGGPGSGSNGRSNNSSSSSSGSRTQHSGLKKTKGARAAGASTSARPGRGSRPGSGSSNDSSNNSSSGLPSPRHVRAGSGSAIAIATAAAAAAAAAAAPRVASSKRSGSGKHNTAKPQKLQQTQTAVKGPGTKLDASRLSNDSSSKSSNRHDGDDSSSNKLSKGLSPHGSSDGGGGSRSGRWSERIGRSASASSRSSRQGSSSSNRSRSLSSDGQNSSSSSSSSGRKHRSSSLVNSSRGRGRSSASRHAFSDVRLKDFPELQRILSAHGSSASLADLSALCSRLKVVASGSAADKAAMLERLWQLLLPQLHAASPRHCAEFLLTASKLGQSPEGLYEQCLQQLVATVSEAEPRNLSNAIYAIATSPHPSIITTSLAPVRDVFLPAITAQAACAYPQAIANTAYSLAVINDSSLRLPLLQLLLAVDPSLWAQGTPQELSNTLWAAGVLGVQLPEQHREALLQGILAAAESCKPQHISNSVYGLTLLGQQLQRHQMDQLVTALQLKPIDAQATSGMVWCAAKMGLQLQQQQADAAVASLLAAADQLLPQTISTTLWGIATMELSVAEKPLLQLLEVLLAVSAPEAQALSNSLWAAAKMKAELSTSLLEALYEQLAAVLDTADPQTVSNALWAAAAMQPQPFCPRVLLGMPEQQQSRQQRGYKHWHKQREQRLQGARQLQKPVNALSVVVPLVSEMKPLELSNVALALALLGERCMDLLQPVYAAAVAHLRDLQRSSNSSVSVLEAFGRQAVCNLCWAGAILDLRQQADQLLELAAACDDAWPKPEVLSMHDRNQLCQLHMWLVEVVGTQGLAACLSERNLEDCKQSLRTIVAAQSKPSLTQLQVFMAAQQVPCLGQVRLEAATPDGLMSIDVLAVALPMSSAAAAEAAIGPAASEASGTSSSSAAAAAASANASGSIGIAAEAPQQQQQQLVAIEFDGPWHWRRPDRALTGPSQFRNQLLARRGYVVVTIPYWQWMRLRPAQHVEYLQTAVLRALAAAELDIQLV